MSVSINDQPYEIEITEENVSATITTAGAQGATGPTGPQGPTGATGPQGPSGVIAVTSPITNSGTSTSADIGIQDGTTAQKGAVQLEDSTSSTSTTKAATPNSVKSTYDLANGKPSLSSSNPVALGTAAPGTGTAASKDDHVHPTTGLLLSASASAARPLLTSGAYLSGSGLVLAGLAANYASSPDSAALSITGDMDVKVKVALTDWTPSANNVLAARYNVSTTRSWLFRVLTDGTLQWLSSADGTNTAVSVVSTVATGITDGATKWVRATIDVDNGASGNSVKFYTSDDGSSWTQLGTTVTTAGTTSIFDGTQALEIGSRQVGAVEPLTGTVYRTIIQSGFDNANNTSNLAFDADFSTQTADALAFTESSSNAATVTINTTRYTYGLPNIVWTAVGTTALTAGNTDSYRFFTITKATTIDMWGFEVTSGPASSAVFYIGLYSTDDNFQPTGSPLLADNQTIGTSATGIFRKQITPITLQPGTYALGTTLTVNFTARSFTQIASPLVSAIGANAFATSATRARTAGTFGTAEAWQTLNSSTTGPAHFVFLRWKAA